jgi:TonB family protein
MKNRYLVSFTIAFLIYATIILAIYLNISKLSKTHTSNKLSKKNISFSIITQKPPQNKSKKQSKKDTKKIKKQKKKFSKKKIAKKEIKKPQKIIKKFIPKRVIKQSKNIIKTPLIDSLKLKYYALIRKKIEANKRYPNRAFRRKLSSKVKVEFQVSKDGKLKNIKFLSGKKIFFKASKKAIQKSFPIKIDKGIFEDNFVLKITLDYSIS